MFFEQDKMQKEDFNDIAKKAKTNWYVTELTHYDDCIYVKYFNGGYGPQPAFSCTDFEMKGLGAYHTVDLSKLYRKEMYKIFGEKYKQELLNKLENEKQQIIEELNF